MDAIAAALWEMKNIRISERSFVKAKVKRRTSLSVLQGNGSIARTWTAWRRKGGAENSHAPHRQNQSG
jgi:hypothetical protein